MSRHPHLASTRAFWLFITLGCALWAFLIYMVLL